MTGSRHRLLLVLTEFPPAVGGMQTHARHLAAHLARRGHVVEVLTYRVTDAVLAADAAHFDAGVGYPVRRILSRLGYWFNVQRILAHVRQFGPDAVYASTVFYGLLKQRAGVPVLCRSVGNDVLRPWQGYPFALWSTLVASPRLQHAIRRWTEHGWQPDWVDHLFRRQRERLMRQAAVGHTRILANSRYTANLLRGIGVLPERIEIVAGGVDARHFGRTRRRGADARAELGLAAHDVVVLTVCRLVAKKGVEVLLDAVAALRASVPGLKLVVVGDGPRRRAYEARAAALGLGQTVVFAGRVPHERVRDYFWASNMFVLASYESRHAGGAARDVETMGRVLCEANAAGVPLIATDSGGVPSVIRDGVNGLLVLPGDSTALAQAMERLWREPAFGEQLVRAGLRRARNEFDWSVIMRRHEQAIADAIRPALAHSATQQEEKIV